MQHENKRIKEDNLWDKAKLIDVKAWLAVQPMMTNPIKKVIYIDPLSSFKIKYEFPTAKKCNCAMTLLMRSGCQCRGV